MSCFGMGIKLSAQEKEELSIFVDTAMQSTTLINDFHSWPKEIKHHIETPGSELPFNAVAILMRYSGYSEKDSMQKLREKQRLVGCSGSASGFMEAESTRQCRGINSTHFVMQLSRYFQIRDDYQNLMSDQYAMEKGFAEDLDEGKISLPLIYCLQSPAGARYEITGIFKHRAPDTLTIEMKRFIINEMGKTGALESTYVLLQEMQKDLLGELRRLEGEFGSQNPTLELVLRKLWV